VDIAGGRGEHYLHQYQVQQRGQKAKTKPLNLGIIIRFRNSQSPQTWPGLVGKYAMSSFPTIRLLKFCQQHLSIEQAAELLAI
jgi:hypothetical protein